ncbi:proteasome subunit beta type-7-like [Zophobas morio]|uniref:proteasome subunit beta type-7-like n=1 Tax=Zophobas morio TaxID=2755281 RepID=UPI0030834F8A
MSKPSYIKTFKGGFSFENCARNQLLYSKGFEAPPARKTGTTICGLIFKEGVVLGADTRATDDTTVADKNCEKIHYLAPNIYCCGAGTAADTENVTLTVSAQLNLHRLSSNRESRGVTACRLLKQMLFRYQGYLSAALVLGGVDLNGPFIYSIYPHGSSDKLPYATMGSGSLAAMAVFESGYRPNLELEEAKALVSTAIKSGIFNDLGSGSNVDLCVITRDGVSYLRNVEKPVCKPPRGKSYRYPLGITPVLSSCVLQLSDVDIETEVTSMEID